MLILLLGGIFTIFQWIPQINAYCLPVFCLGLFCITQKKPHKKWLEVIAWLGVVILGFFIAIYRPEGFSYPLVWETQSLYDGGRSFTLLANTSKALGGYFVIIWLLSHFNDSVTPLPLEKSIAITAAGIIALLLIARLFFGIGWQPKLSKGIGFFIFINLGITVLSEEAFFRLLIQDKIASFFNHKAVGLWVAGSTASVLFAFSHTPTIGTAWFLFLIAGAIYSAVFAYTQRFTLAIAVHFGLNIMHFIFLEYPLSV